ncbi:N-acetylmuramoyl-L-alanine amidase family protein [Saccharibacillus sp. CPCC 101409]|uniref:N-acetylmuramoyl-L-alanine amidase family protein n=1 Tax=Saccharibacillus sp. CPCC 101409 TaxID=3058041 RepID=UPI0026732138|nr:N-acetylmuramoyl-L-alanine amidase family protein [Saccharibacillus sp. CPCC 101409]MDO3410334.1 N-acetylmuramoyl-L-alanine amidase family protein [Saccharibacillus sp. CPCC 101409]
MKFGQNEWRKTAAAFLAVLLLLALALPGGTGRASAASAAAGTGIVLDGRALSGAEVITVGGTAMVPIRIVSEQLGYSVGWNKASGRITIGSSASSLVLTVGSLTAESGTGSLTLLQAPFLRANTTYVPLRFVGSQMGLNVKWNQASHTVYLQSQAEEAVPSNPTVPAVPAAPAAPQTPVDPGTSAPAPSAPAAASIDSISFSDNRLTISAGAAVTPTGTVLKNPDRIVVDLPNAAFGTNLLQGGELRLGQVVTVPVADSLAVKQVRYSLFSQSPSTVRVVIDLNRSVGYNLYTQGSLVFADLNDNGEAPPVGANGKKIVVIDPGHGDHDSGGVGITGVKEKDVVLRTGLKVAELLKQEPDIDLIMTRSDDTFVTLDGRAQIANNANADLYLSIHANIATPSAVGTETYYADAARSKSLSDIIQEHVQAATGFRDRGSKQANYLVIRKTTMPAALVEIGFLSNSEEERLMTQDDFQQKVAEAIVAGIKEYLELN